MSVNEFATIERVYRGTKFVFEEADVATYDKCLKKATNTVPDPITGQDTESVDENLLLRLLMRECLREPKGMDFQTIGLRLMRQLERDVRGLHFDVEPTDKVEPDKPGRRAKKAPEPEEDDGTPNSED